jgi:hypothetical protein
MSSTKSVLGLVRNRAQADAAVGALLNTGFVRADVSTLSMNGPPAGEFVPIEGLPSPDHTMAAVTAGSALGTVLGLLAGLGLLVIPGFGPFLLAGPILAAIGGALAGATTGGIAGAIVGLGISELESRQYAGKIKRGAILLSIRADDRDQRAHARKVLEGYGATNIATVGGEPVHQHAEAALAS